MNAAIASAPARTDSNWSTTTPLRHMPQLDGLRAIAAGLVVCYHFWGPGRQYVHLGGIGVRIFFVLSGFLITGILLRSRLRIDGGQAGAGLALRRFYIRRFLRIFPLYYFALLLAWYWKISGAREGMTWHLTYLSNIHFFLENASHPGRWGGRVAHLWSLSVEEQFYLLWPWVILFARRSWLPAIALGAAAVGPIFRFVVYSETGNDIVSVLPLGCIESLALGAYLAMTILPEFKSHPLVRPINAWPLWSGLLLFAAYQSAEQLGGFGTFRIVVFDLAVALVGLWVVARAAAGMQGPAGRLLESRPLRYLGTISYGIYVYHLMLPELLPRVARRLGHPQLFASFVDQSFLFLVFYGVVTVLIAALSWHFLERPINALKDRFEYQ